MTTIKAKIGSILTRSRPSDSTEEETVENAEAEAEDDAPTNLLHECSECGTVYLSEDSHSCSNCNSMTTAIETAD